MFEYGGDIAAEIQNAFFHYLLGACDLLIRPISVQYSGQGANQSPRPAVTGYSPPLSSSLVNTALIFADYQLYLQLT